MRVFSPLRRSVLCVFLALSILTLGGCGESETLYPVSGKVFCNVDPLTGGTVSFTPDATKGNTTKLVPGGKIGADGTYTLISGGRPGAPLGWYKVSIVTNAPGETPSTVKVPPRFADPNRSDLTVEVVANPEPDRYNFRTTLK